MSGKPRGFAAMDDEVVKSIAAKGGRAAHEAGTAHEFSRDEAREAGRKGGFARAAKRAGLTIEEYLRRNVEENERKGGAT